MGLQVRSGWQLGTAAVTTQVSMAMVRSNNGRQIQWAGKVSAGGIGQARSNSQATMVAGLLTTHFHVNAKMVIISVSGYQSSIQQTVTTPLGNSRYNGRQGRGSLNKCRLSSEITHSNHCQWWQVWEKFAGTREG